MSNNISYIEWITTYAKQLISTWCLHRNLLYSVWHLVRRCTEDSYISSEGRDIIYGGTRCLAGKHLLQCIQIFGNDNITNVTVVCIWCPEWFPECIWFSEWFPVSIFLIFCVYDFLNVYLISWMISCIWFPDFLCIWFPECVSDFLDVPLRHPGVLMTSELSVL